MFALIVDLFDGPTGAWHPSYVAGIFRTFDKALAFGGSLKVAGRSTRLIELAVSDFPFFLIEDDDFLAATRADLVAYVERAGRMHRRPGPEDLPQEIHMNVFRIRDEYAPQPAAADRMGSLPHYHVVNDTLDEVVGHSRFRSSSLWLDSE